MNLYILNNNEEIVATLSGKADNSACHFFNAKMPREVNKGTSLTFEVDMEEIGEVDYLKEENMVVVPDDDVFRLFIIREVVDVHGTDFIKEVYCEDASIELADEVVLEVIEGKQEISTALNKMLSGTRWTAGEVDNVYIRTLAGEYKGSSVLAGITTLIGEYGVEVDYSVEFAGNRITKRCVHIKEAFGRTLGKRFEYKKDIVSLKRTVATGDIKTAIIPFGKINEETGEAVSIEGVSWSQPSNALAKPLGQSYLEDLEATAQWGYKGADGSRRARWVVINFEECETAEELISLAYLQLRRFTSPTVTYEVDAQDLYLLTGDKDFSFESVSLGDLVNIIDHDFVPALTLQSRIVKIEKNLNFPAESKITMGTIIKTIVDKDLQSQINDLNYKVSTVASSIDFTPVEDRLDNLETNISSGNWETISQINNLLFGESVGYHYIEEGNGIWVYDKPKDSNPTKAVAIKGGTIGLASYDSQLQKWVVGTFIDGNSVNASMINTGTLSAERIQANSLTLNHLDLSVRNKINEIDGKATTGYVDTKVEAIAGEINLSVSSKYSTKAETSSAVSTAKSEAVTSAVSTSKSYADTKKAEAIDSAVSTSKSYADTKKAEAVATASSDAQSKADAVKNTLTPLISSKAEKTDVYSKVETYSKGETDSAITIAKNEINLGVSSNYETKSNVETKIESVKTEVTSTAKSYADTKKTEAINSAVGTAQDYADTKKVEAISSAVGTAQTYADTKKAEAIATASSDATTKSNAVKTALTPLIEAKASKTDVYTKTETYTKAESDSAIKIAKDSINLGVSNTYETKTNVETKISSATSSTLTSAKSYADTKKTEAINSASSDASTKVNNAINTLETGGVNLLVINKITRSKYLSNTGSVISEPAWFYSDYIAVKGFKNVRISGFTNLGQSPSTCFYDADKVFISGINNGNSGNSSGITNKCELMTVPTNAVYMRCSGEIANLSTLKIEQGTKATAWSQAPEDVQSSINVKANTVDVYKKTETYSKEQADAQIKIAKDEINLGVTSTYETKSNVETKISSATSSTLTSAKGYADTKKTEAISSAVGTAQSYADTKKAEAISSASADATSKVNSAKSELNTAIGKKANATDVYNKTETYTKTEADSAIKIAKDSINLTVSNTYETKTNVESQISSATSSTLASAQTYADTKKTEAISSAVGTAQSYADTKKAEAISSAVGTAQSYADTKKAEAIETASTDAGEKVATAKTELNTAIGKKANATDVYNKTETYTKVEADAKIKVAKDEINLGVSKVEQIATASLQGRMMYTDPTFISGTNGIATYNNTGNGNVAVSRVVKSSDCPTTSGYMLQITTKGTASPYNGGFFFATNTRANAIFITKILAKLPVGTELSYHSNSIGTDGQQVWLTSTSGTGNWEEYICKVSCGSSGTFSSTNYFALQGGSLPVTWYIAFATVFDITDTSNLESRMNSAEQKITDSAIISTVSSQFYKKGETDTNYATKSQLTQTVNDFTFKFDNSRNPNLMSNGNPTGSNFNGWYVEGVNAWLWTNNPDGPIAIASTNTAGETYAWSPTIKIIEGGKYSISFELLKEWGAESTEVFLLGGSSESNLYEYVNNITGTIGDSSWRRVTVTVDIPSNIKYLKFRIDHNKCLNTGGNYTVIFDKFMFIKGDGIYPPIWYPAENEINNSITTINNNGIIVEDGALAIKNKSGSKVFYGDTNGNLILAGSITSGANITGGTLTSINGDMYFNMNSGYILLYNNGVKVGQTNKNSISGTSIYGVSNGAEYGSYSSLSAKTSSTASTYSMMAMASGADLTSYIKAGFNLGYTFHTNNWNFRMGTSSELQWNQSGSNHNSFITEGSEGMLRMYGDNGVYLGYRVGDTNNYVIAIRESGSHTYPRTLNMFSSEGDAPSDGEYSVEITAPLKMRGQSIDECSNIKTLGLEIVEPLAFYSDDDETQSTTYSVTKNTQNIIEFIGSTQIVNGESTVLLPENVVFRNYMAVLTPIGLNRTVSLVEKSDDSFKLMGDDGIVDYVIKFESVDYSKYLAESISVDNIDVIQRSEDDSPKVIELCEDSLLDENASTTVDII